MTSRPHHVTFAVGITVVVVVTLLYLLQKTHTHLQDVQAKLFETQAHYTGLSRQFDSLFEYKERLERSFVALKNEKSSLFEMDNVARDELTTLKSNFARQIQILQEDLTACRTLNLNHDELEPASSGNTGGGDSSSKTKTRSSSPSVPLLAPLSLAREREVGGVGGMGGNSGSGTGNGNTDPGSGSISVNFKRKPLPLSSVSVNSVGGSGKKGGLAEGTKEGKDKEAIQSPIGHVPVHPGQPSGDPNEDTAGNVLI